MGRLTAEGHHITILPYPEYELYLYLRPQLAAPPVTCYEALLHYFTVHRALCMWVLKKTSFI